jgi:hypothetical protein
MLLRPRLPRRAGQPPRRQWTRCPTSSCFSSFRLSTSLNRGSAGTLLMAVHGVCQRWRALCGDTPGIHLTLVTDDDNGCTALEQHKDDAVGVRLTHLLVRRWKHVTGINLCGRFVSDTVVAALVSHCSGLTVVGCHDTAEPITDVGIMSLAMHCKQLTKIEFTESLLTDVGVVALAEVCSQLTHINLSADASPLTDASVLAFARNCPRLTRVNFSGCDKLTDASAVALAEKCPALETVEFQRCALLTDATLHAFAQHCPRLESVAFGYNVMTDAGVCSLSTQCKHLTCATFVYMPLLTDVAVIAMAQGCPKLSKFRLWCCDSLTDGSAIALAKHGANLTSIEFVRCNGLHSGAVVALMDCPKLTSLRIFYCSGIEQSALVALKQLRPSVKVTRDYETLL